MATIQQIPVIASRMVEFQEKFKDLSTEDGQWVIQNTKEAISIFVEAIKNRGRKVADIVGNILSQVNCSVKIPTTVDKFVAKDKFLVNTKNDAKVKISYVRDNFLKWFGNKTEESFIGSTLNGRNLLKDSVDSPILQELGGNEKAETTLIELYTMMELQPNGEKGNLLTDGSANIFYIKDIGGTLRAVYVFVDWYDGGWFLDARSVGYSRGWFVGNRVFSRNFLCFL